MDLNAGAVHATLMPDEATGGDVVTILFSVNLCMREYVRVSMYACITDMCVRCFLWTCVCASMYVCMYVSHTHVLGMCVLESALSGRLEATL
jgi:hypothetical protein